MIENALIENFLIRINFDLSKGYYHAGAIQAYLDFNRTLPIDKENQSQEQRDLKKQQSQTFLIFELKNLICENIEKKANEYQDREISNGISAQEYFDKRHEVTCNRLKKYWDELSIGQCQKWINMTLKYWLVFGETKIPNIAKNAKYFHIPIDSYVQNEFLKKAFSSHNPWSKINEYGEYFNYQIYFRENNPNTIPLIAEFDFFNKININLDYEFEESLEFWIAKNKFYNPINKGNRNLLIFLNDSEHRHNLYKSAIQKRIEYINDNDPDWFKISPDFIVEKNPFGSNDLDIKKVLNQENRQETFFIWIDEDNNNEDIWKLVSDTFNDDKLYSFTGKIVLLFKYSYSKFQDLQLNEKYKLLNEKTRIIN